MPTLDVEQQLYRQGHTLVAGVDEVGRGPLAGPVVAGAVILPPNLEPSTPWLQHVDDSKRLTPRQREVALEYILKNALAIGTGQTEAHEIDTLGILKANKMAMLRSIEALPYRPQYLLIDFLSLEESELPFWALPGGDSCCYSIAAASIVAKVARDRLLVEADNLYPGYGFRHHKGYGTAEHLRLLKRLGPSPIHRLSFSPVRLAQQARKGL